MTASATSWTDVAKGWAPILIAAGVFILQAMQLRWQRGFNRVQADLAERQLRSDVRKFRLSLIEKRWKVLEAITRVLAVLYQNSFQIEDQPGLFECLLTGQTLFDEGLASRLDKAWELQIKYHTAFSRRVANAGAAIGGRQVTAYEDRVDELREQLFEELKQLQADMIKATRVDGASLTAL